MALFVRRNILFFLSLMSAFFAFGADKHVRFEGISLELSRDGLIGQLVEKGYQQIDSVTLAGQVGGLNVKVTVVTPRDTSRINHVLLTTQYQQSFNLYQDYNALMQWMKKQYGWPDWESMVRSHRFARWFIGFNKDIVMIEKASLAIEIWFYEDHQKRDYDYYSILKYCEQHPAKGVPHYTARQCIVWKGDAPAEKVRKAAAKTKGRNVRRGKSARNSGRGKARRRRR